MLTDPKVIEKKLAKKTNQQALYVLIDERDGKISNAKLLPKHTKKSEIRELLSVNIHHHPEDIKEYEIKHINQYYDIISKLPTFFSTNDAREYLKSKTSTHLEADLKTIRKYFHLIIGEDKINSPKIWVRNSEIIQEKIPVIKNRGYTEKQCGAFQ